MTPRIARPPAILALALALGACCLAVEAPGQFLVSSPRPTSADLNRLKAAYAARPHEAESALEYARALVERNTIAARALAGRVLRRAVTDHPGASGLHLALADLYYRQGYLTLARQQLERAVADSTDPAPAYVRLGRIAFRDWLKFQRPEALTVAERYWQESADRDPRATEPWLGLGVLALVADDGARAERCARRCLEAAGGGTAPRGEAWLLLGAAAYAEGKPELADSAFSLALPLLRPSARALLNDITPAASDADTAALGALAADARARAEFVRRFWRSRDPDLTTGVNELRLEFLSRGALAYFLYFDQRQRVWDERGALLVRYGVPEYVQYNPPGLGPTPTTTNLLLWSYPSLGMDVLLEDRYLNESYDLPISLSAEVDAVPDPQAVAAAEREGRLTTAGRGLFHPGRRGTAPLPGEARVALFRRVRGFDPTSAAPPGRDVARVEVYLGTSGGAETAGVEVQAVVFDSTWREVARSSVVGAVACESDTTQVAQVNFDLPAGEYTVGLSARDKSRQAAAAWRLPVQVGAPLPGRLEISDLDLACEYRAGLSGGSFDKSAFTVVPNPRRELARGGALGVYFEIYGLVPDDAGRSQLSVEYTVRSLRRDRRPFLVRWVNPRRDEPRVQVVREDEVPGRVRYQFVRAGLEEAEPGPYRLEVRVEDRISGQTAGRAIDFTVVP